MAGRAVVLGGGGVTGVAWELGVIAGLAEKGIDLTGADLLIGTSAGSVVAAQITSGTPIEELYDEQLVSTGREVVAKLRLSILVRLGWAAARGGDEQTVLRRVGAMARRAKTMPQAERKAIIDARLPNKQWPRQRLLITAIAIDSGEFATFDRDSGVSLVDAVAASCAVPGVWPPSDVNGRLFMDGGIRSPANIDLVSRQGQTYDRVVVIAPLTATFRRSAGVGPQVAALPAGTRTVVVAPDEGAKAAIGNNVLDPRKRADAARAGRVQAGTVAAEIEAVWTG
jgi:NTE family protein